MDREIMVMIIVAIIVFTAIFLAVFYLTDTFSFASNVLNTTINDTKDTFGLNEEVRAVSIQTSYSNKLQRLNEVSTLWF